VDCKLITYTGKKTNDSIKNKCIKCSSYTGEILHMLLQSQFIAHIITQYHKETSNNMLIKMSCMLIWTSAWT